ncbi:unnamed protein product [Phytophthora lilii]|uniref:Unnamed protein product n=1 Tax=Phytophthora lilii TaxID=2077276 RepID=A0A9W7CK21_9STRA|nr:unnamed protein product [Phytophthora lilii]
MTSASIILVAFAALFLSSSDLITSGQSSRTNDQNTYFALFHWRFFRFLVSIPALTAQENRNMHVAQHESGEIDELLAFVGTFDIGEDAGGIKPQAHSPDDLSESTWLDDLEKLFMETNPLKPVAAAVLKMTPGSLSAQSILSKDLKSLTLTAAAPVATAAKKASSRPRVSRKEELEYLRRKVKEMESKLHHLKETERALPAHDATESSGNEQETPPPGPSITLWKTMAQRQKNQRDMVEVENATLREQLKTQVRMAKSLKRILCKRTRDNDQVQSMKLVLLGGGALTVDSKRIPRRLPRKLQSV